MDTSPPPAARRRYTQTDLRVVAFRLADHECVVDLATVQEIIRPTNLLSVLGAPDYVLGLAKRRGRIVPIVDLRCRLGLPSVLQTASTCALIAKLSYGPVGFVVDSASELMWVKTQDFEIPSPVLAGIERPYNQGVAYVGERALLMLDFEQIMAPDERNALQALRATLSGEATRA